MAENEFSNIISNLQLECCVTAMLQSNQKKVTTLKSGKTHIYLTVSTRP